MNTSIDNTTEDIFPNISNWVKLGGVILPSTGALMIALAAIIPYPIVVKTSAIIRPVGELRIVEAATSGIISDIFVKENQIVTKGEKIAAIEDYQLQTKNKQMILKIQQNSLQLTQIDAQLQALQTQIIAEKNAMNRAIASAQAELSRSQREYQDKQLIAQAQVQEALAELELAREEMQRYQQLSHTGAISSLQLKQKQQTLKAAQARLKRAQVGLNPTNANMAIAQENIAQQKARGESTIASLQKEQQSLQQQRIQLENHISSDRQELQQIQTDLQKTIIRTTQPGTILKLELRNPGQVVSSGDAIAQIAPSNSNLVVKARVSPQDIGKVKLCKVAQVANCQTGKVKMRISAYPYPDYGILKGAVTAITADTIALSNASGRGGETASLPSVQSYYEVTIEPEKSYLQKGKQQYPLKPGMEVKAEIFAKKETLITFILRKARLLVNK
ncbi:MAG: HlyD family efflux transporter periplasmic adaptor subunit [Nostocaceae cyanobacterium]|nr:HlyD family efflux transporter periplasmic adaptor subunit [Nostocaceae cyanobacterium]